MGAKMPHESQEDFPPTDKTQKNLFRSHPTLIPPTTKEKRSHNNNDAYPTNTNTNTNTNRNTNTTISELVFYPYRIFSKKKKRHKKLVAQASCISTTTTATGTMDINTADEIVIFYANNVIFERIRDSGKERYEPGYVTIRADKRHNWKGWIISRNFAGNVLIFNGMIPGGVPIVAYEDSLSIRFGKVPSLSYVDGRRKPIPTLWKVTFTTKKDFEVCFGLMKVFSRLADAVNNGGAPPHLRNPVIALPTTLPTLPTPPTPPTPSTSLTPPTPHTPAETALAPCGSPDMATMEKGYYNFSSDEETDFGSPIFGQS